ncbi:MAG: aldo/keto reductase [Spirochaetota bacterium]
MYSKEYVLPTAEFGRTGHRSTRTIFGAAAFSDVSQYEADKTMELLNKYGVNHIDVARSYGDAELRLAPWMKQHRKSFFLATKTGERTKAGAKRELYESLERLQTDVIDLWQMHCLVDEEEWNIAMGPNGALEAFTEAKEEGLVRFVGVTGHGFDAPRMHRRSLQVYPFDTVLFPFNYMQMKDWEYADHTRRLLNYCKRQQVAVQTIKAIAKKEEKSSESAFQTWYEPLSDAAAIRASVHWVLQEPAVFLNTAGDIHVLPRILEAAAAFEHGPSEREMERLEKEFALEQLFTK